MRFLIADDMYTNRLRIITLLKSMGFTCDEAVDGQDAIDKIIASEYDIVLLDIEMPVMNGFETVRYIRENLEGNKKRIPVIIISSHCSLNYFKGHDSYDYNGILTKPFTKQKLETTLKKVMGTI